MMSLACKVCDKTELPEFPGLLLWRSTVIKNTYLAFLLKYMWKYCDAYKGFFCYSIEKNDLVYLWYEAETSGVLSYTLLDNIFCDSFEEIPVLLLKARPSKLQYVTIMCTVPCN